MGQYYKVMINRGAEMIIGSPIVDGSWEGYKLMEHSWFENDFVNCVMEELSRQEATIAWIGDYANDDDTKDERENKLLSLFVANEDDEHEWHYTSFRSNRKILINLSKKVFIDLEQYWIDSNRKYGDSIIHPLPLLTAVGNGKGGGDYIGINMEDVGSWAFDTICVDELDNLGKWLDLGYQEIKVDFQEE